MVCPYCGAETAVVNSRSQKRKNQVWRRRQCQKCHQTFTTHESVDLSKSLMVGDKPFIADLLFTEILLTLHDFPNSYITAREITATVIGHLLQKGASRVLQAPEISKATATVLKRFSKRAYLRYVAEHPSLQK